MASQILDALNTLVTPALTSRASTALGESEIGVTKALGATFPALLSALVDKSGDPGIAPQLFALVTDPSNDGGVLGDPTSVLGERRSASAGLAGTLVSLLFGARSENVSAALARYAGLKSGSASSLIQLAAPLLLGVLGDKVRRGNLGAPGLFGLLAGQRDAIRAALPAELGPAIGVPTVDVDRDRDRPRAVAPPPAAGTSWLWPALIGLALLLGFWWLFARRPEAPQVADTRPLAAAEPPPVGAAPPARVVRRTLPNGVELELPDDGLEVRLAGFIDDASRKPDENVWFEFDRLQFETGSAQLRPSSRSQLHDVAAILGAYPAVRVKIGGYTDDTGDPAANQQLSQARAESVRTQLVADGVAAERIEAEGYGQAHPIATNDTEAGRAKNRRIALRVTDK
jgi:LPXTG-motif cell wall-anchored protein